MLSALLYWKCGAVGVGGMHGCVSPIPRNSGEAWLKRRPRTVRCCRIARCSTTTTTSTFEIRGFANAEHFVSTVLAGQRCIAQMLQRSERWGL